jgi:hypothetical protein
MFEKKIVVFSFLLLLPLLVAAQNDSVRYDIGITGVASTGTYSPLWLQSKSYGKIVTAPYSADLLAGITKDYGKSKRTFDYGFKADMLLQTWNTNTNICFHELYAKVRFHVFDLVVGEREDHLGNQDSTLSCGGILFSENARPMPKISLGIEHFIPVPFTYGYVEVKGALVHGWFTDNTFVKHALLHHKYAYIRLGGKLPVHIQYGLDHVAQWSGYVPGQGQQPSGLHDFVDIFFGRSGGTDALLTDQINALGNHIISQSMKLDVDISDFKLSGYWQNISEDGPIREIWNTPNLPDGLWGVSLRNSKFPFVKGILYEYLNTTDQSGPYHDKDGIVYGGADGYFRNGVYQSGWTYYSRTIGTPFITSPVYNVNGEIYTLNNRVQVHHFGIEGDILGYQYKALSSFSKNYGDACKPPYSEMIKNTSMMLEVNKLFPKLANINIGCSVAADFGKLFGNTVGCQFTVRKTGNLFNY